MDASKGVASRRRSGVGDGYVRHASGSLCCNFGFENEHSQVEPVSRGFQRPFSTDSRMGTGKLESSRALGEVKYRCGWRPELSSNPSYERLGRWQRTREVNKYSELMRAAVGYEEKSSETDNPSRSYTMIVQTK